MSRHSNPVFGPTLPTADSAEGLTYLIQTQLGYVPKDWQVEAALSLLYGKDTFVTVATGGGKTTLVHASILAVRALKRKRIMALLVLPSRVLAEEQVSIARRKGIRAEAIHRTAILAASRLSPRRDLFREAMDGRFDLVTICPEMLDSPAFHTFITNPTVQATLGFVFVDEVHLAKQLGGPGGFRPAYAKIGDLRNRLSSQDVVWGAWTATCPRSDRLDIQKLLGFEPGHTNDISLPVDRGNIKYITQFLKHPLTGIAFPEVSYLLPPSITTGSDIRHILVYCETIDLVMRLAQWLVSRLPNDLENRAQLIMPFHSMMSEPYQKRVLGSFNRKEVRILVTTALMEVGLDVQTNAVLALSGCLTLGSLLQWLGRGGRSGEASIGIACFADWMREENSLDLFGDAEYGGKKAMAPSVLSERRAKRAKADTALVQFANSAPDCAHKIVVETYGGSTFSPLADCCSACFPDQSLYEVNGQWEAQDRVEAARTHQISRLNTDHRALNKEELASATLQLNNWKVKRWAEKLGSRRSIFGPVQLLPNVDLKRLAEKLPLVTTFERFGCVMEGWKSLEEEGDQLWKCARQIMDSIVAECEKDKAVKAAATAKKQASKKKKKSSESAEVTARLRLQRAAGQV
ncbi:hypothetical protein M407DRAFT_6015 [Tulasnella calospora MUT 4182]|uniref:DNA 3'-5' helicase n=1 Tax=Tulasnella calospora MUT 4182 TaxID=1051891 RepID=A0A0C3QQB8_9AGAM|nr:hypothetical protein M407DRAFT_6015 [Tulasnella calospora MUT 4182]